ncbi:hypothetical protein [Gephyromycinifex aptenodytis]|uniref:hypothetical protein n=1 Tax=Gephyromycinifex aptenodytis TaxID=2716227 RepID=UPI0014481CA1|nr:hypothetical protein [Gephyromycinifex aptenodytis]
MTTAYTALTLLHWVGLALLVIGYLLSFNHGVIHPVMVWGARLQLLLGLAIVAVVEMGSLMTLNHAWVAVKLLLAVGVVGLCEVAQSKAAKGQNKPLFMHLAAALTLVTVMVATLWH